MVILARMLGIVADLFTIAGAWLLGSRFGRLSGVIAAVITAAAPVQIRTSTGIFVDSIATAFTAWGMVFLFRYRDGERLKHLFVASVLFGFAVGTKYPAILALLPLTVEALSSRRRWHAILAIGTVVFAFLLTTPYALVDSPTFLSDTIFELLHARTGHFGSFGQSSRLTLFGELWATLGPAGLLCLLGAFALSCRGGSRWRSMRPLLLYVVPVLAVLATARISAERYVVQMIPFAAVLVGAFCQWLWNGPHAWRKPVAGAVAAVAMGWPLVSGIQLQLQLRSPSQSRAHAWCDQWIAPHAVIVQEAYTIEARNPIEQFDLLVYAVDVEVCPRYGGSGRVGLRARGGASARRGREEACAGGSGGFWMVAGRPGAGGRPGRWGSGGRIPPGAELQDGRRLGAVRMRVPIPRAGTKVRSSMAGARARSRSRWWSTSW